MVFFVCKLHCIKGDFVMKIKNIVLLLLLAVLSNCNIIMAMDKPVAVSEELRPVDMKLILMSRENRDIKPVLSEGANPNVFDVVGIEVLDQNMIQAGVQTTVGFTPLLYACMFGNIDNAKLLLDYGADVNLKSKRSNISPVYAAFFKPGVPVKKHYELAQLLIDHGADINVYGQGHHSFLQRAVQELDEQFIKKLLKETKLEVNSVDINKHNALAEAVIAGANLNIIRALFDAGCLPVNDFMGASLFHKAVERIDTLMGGDTSIFDLLHDKGLDVNSKDIHNETPLHWASEVASYNVVKKLLELGADPRIKNKDGKTAYQLSASNPNKTVKILLSKAKHPVVLQQIVKKEDKPVAKQVDQKKEEAAKPAAVATKKKKRPKKKKTQAQVQAIETQMTLVEPVAETAAEEIRTKKTEVEEAPAQESVIADKKTKKEKPSLKEKISAVKQTVVGVLNPERREASILQAGRTYAVAAGAPATRAPQPEEKLITLIDDRVDIAAYKWKPMSEINPLVGLSYSKHVQEKMNNTSDFFHNFSTQVEKQLGSYMNEKVMQEATEKHSAKIKYTIPAKMRTLNKDFEGRFEFIVRDGEIRHRFFKPDKQVGKKSFEQEEKAPRLLKSVPTEYQ